MKRRLRPRLNTMRTEFNTATLQQINIKLSGDLRYSGNDKSHFGGSEMSEKPLTTAHVDLVGVHKFLSNENLDKTANKLRQ